MTETRDTQTARLKAQAEDYAYKALLLAQTVNDPMPDPTQTARAIQTGDNANLDQWSGLRAAIDTALDSAESLPQNGGEEATIIEQLEAAQEAFDSLDLIIADALSSVAEGSGERQTPPSAQEVLRHIQWSHGMAGGYCPWCREPECNGHKIDCPVAAAIASRVPAPPAAPEQIDPRLILNQQHEAHRVASIYGVWEREKNELHILRALQDAARSAVPEAEGRTTEREEM